ncbi:MAG: molybdate transport system substrate-binding protein [Myxococcales bacterium]|jgi:molybdate transport system substrate-binding protein|nr:molybdate transport system substrate-binding protein [Myxococcales bacterium]
MTAIHHRQNRLTLLGRDGKRLVAIGFVATVVVASVVSTAAAVEPKPAPPRELVVFAAASLRESFEAMARVFEARHPTVHVRFNLAGSQELRLQIEQGAKADVFAGADLVHVGVLAQQGLVDRPRTFARNLPVVIVPRGNPGGLKSFADLTKARRLVIGTPEVPIGRYTLMIFKRAAPVYGDAFTRTLEEHVASRELNVRQVLAKVTLGEADAGIVYRTDAATAHGAVEAIEIPTAINVVAEYALAVVKTTEQPAPALALGLGLALTLANDWCDFVQSADGQKVLVQYGFLAAERKP